MAAPEHWLHRDLNALRDLRIQKIWNGPSQLNLAARLTLFAITYGRAVRRYVEIGTGVGGSALIANQAFELLERQGATPRGACIDRSFANLSAGHRQELEARFTFVQTPTSLLGARRAYTSLGGHFDLALIDGGRGFDQAVFDSMLLLPYMAPGAYMLLNWAAYPPIARAIDYIAANTSLHPCGAICRHANLAAAGRTGDQFDRAGLYLMRVADDHRPVELTADILEPAAQHNFAAAPNGAEGGFHLGSRAGTSPDIAAAPRGDDLADEDSADPHPAPDRGEAASLRIGVAAIDGTMVARRDEPAHAVDALAATALLDRPFTSAGTDFSGWSGDHPVPASDDDSAVGETWRNGTPGAGKDTAAILPADEVEHYSGLGETWLHAMPSALYEMKMPRVWNAPSQMNLAARLMLFTVIYGRAVTRYVEIGTARGGSALIVSQAFELLKKQGLKPRGACIDRSFADVSSENRQELQKSFTLIERPANLLSAKVAHKSVRGHFDCALVDGGRETDQVVSDALALMPFMAPGAYMLFHWAAYAAVAKALDYLEANTSLQPCGALSLHAHLAGEGKLRGPDHTGGLYLMRVTDRHEPVPVSKIRKKAAAAGRTSSAKK